MSRKSNSRSFSPSPTRRNKILAALATGFLWWLAMQRFGLFALGWIALVPVLMVGGEIVSTRSRFFYGWGAGAFCFALLNGWLLPTIGKASVIIGVLPAGGVFLGALSVMLIALGHGLGVALLLAFWNPQARLWRRSPLLLPLCAALYWLGFEWLRGSGELAHTWGALAFSQWSDVALLQSTFIVGQHGLSALCLWFAASLALWFRSEYSAYVPNLWRLPLVLFVLLHGWGFWRVWEYDRQPSSTAGLVLVGTDVPSLRKNFAQGETHLAAAERATREYFLAKYFHAESKQEESRPAETGESLESLVIWPETTLRVEAGRTGGLEARAVEQLGRELGVSVLSGVQLANDDGTLGNGVMLFSQDGTRQKSGKVRVVPFGERAPFTEVLPVLQLLAPSPPIEPARRARPLDVTLRDGRRLRIGTLICFESCFSHPAKSLVKEGAELLVTVTNDEWFAGTTAPWEHAAMSVIRAAENGVPVVQSSNGGYTFGVDARGRFLPELGGKPEYARTRALPLSIPLKGSG